MAEGLGIGNVWIRLKESGVPVPLLKDSSLSKFSRLLHFNLGHKVHVLDLQVAKHLTFVRDDLPGWRLTP